MESKIKSNLNQTEKILKLTLNKEDCLAFSEWTKVKEEWDDINSQLCKMYRLKPLKNID